MTWMKLAETRTFEIPNGTTVDLTALAGTYTTDMGWKAPESVKDLTVGQVAFVYSYGDWKRGVVTKIGRTKATVTFVTRTGVDNARAGREQGMVKVTAKAEGVNGLLVSSTPVMTVPSISQGAAPAPVELTREDEPNSRFTLEEALAAVGMTPEPVSARGLSTTPDPVTGRIPALEGEPETQEDPRERYFTEGPGRDVVKRDQELIPTQAAPAEGVDPDCLAQDHLVKEGDLECRRCGAELDPAEEAPTKEEALKEIGGCWAGGALTGKALKAFTDGDYVLAYALAQDQKRLQAEDPEEAVHPEERAFRNLPEPRTARELIVTQEPADHVRTNYASTVYPIGSPAVPTRDPLEPGRALQGWAQRMVTEVLDPTPTGYVTVAPGVYVAPMGTPEPTAEDLSDLPYPVQRLRPRRPDWALRAPAVPRCVVGDVVTIHRGDRLYEVIQVAEDEISFGARVAPCDPEDHRDPQWVSLDLLHVRAPLGHYRTEEITGRVRQTREVFSLADGTLRAVRTVVAGAGVRADLVGPPYSLGTPVAKLRAGEALVVDDQCYRVVDLNGDGALSLEPAPWRDRRDG